VTAETDPYLGLVWCTRTSAAPRQDVRPERMRSGEHQPQCSLRDRYGLAEYWKPSVDHGGRRRHCRVQKLERPDGVQARFEMHLGPARCKMTLLFAAITDPACDRRVAACPCPSQIHCAIARHAVAQESLELPTATVDSDAKPLGASIRREIHWRRTAAHRRSALFATCTRRLEVCRVHAGHVGEVNATKSFE
jgi:hypothetical protein